MKKFKEFMDKPMTWGGYLKLCLWCIVFGYIYVFVWFAHMFGWFAKAAEKFKEFLNKKNNEPEEEQ